MSPLALINLAPVAFTFATMFGILVHDMHLDRAARVMLASTTSQANVASPHGLESMLGRAEHTHVERTSLSGPYSSTVPKIPPRDDDRRYIQNKKSLVGGSNDLTHIWPSV